MSRIFAFLSFKTEKRERLIEDFLMINTKPIGGINTAELSDPEYLPSLQFCRTTSQQAFRVDDDPFELTVRFYEGF